MEHRWGQRAPCCVEVTIRCRPSMLGRGYLRDISVSGGFIESDLDPVMASRIALAYSFGSKASARPKLRGWVVRNADRGFGVEWDPLSAAAVRALLQAASQIEVRPLLQADAHSDYHARGPTEASILPDLHR